VLSTEAISAIFTGLTGLLAVIAGMLANRSRRRSEDSRAARKLYRELQKRFLAAMEHIFALEQELVEARRPVPPRPEILEQDDDDDGPPPPTPVGANATA